MPESDRVDLEALYLALHAACERGDDAKLDLWEQYKAELLWSRYALRANEHLPEVQASLRLLCEPVGRTVEGFLGPFLTFCRLFGTVKEPRDVDSDLVDLPFVPFPHQVELARALIESYFRGGTVAIEKSRTMGATWLMLHLICWLWLYVRGTSWLLGSRIENLVDRNAGGKDDDTLIGRCEIIIDALPGYMQPANHDLADKTHRQLMLWVNPDNGNRLTGESSNPNFGHQQRTTGILIDEATKWKDQKEVIKGTRHTCHIRWFVFTPQPDAEAIKALMALPAVQVIQHHWSRHPLYTRAWYANEQRESTEEDVAEQLDLSWEGSAERTIYHEWHDVAKGNYPFTRDRGILFGCWDWGRSDGSGMAIGLYYPELDRVRFLCSHYRVGEDIEYFFPFFGKPITSGIYTYSEWELKLIERIQSWVKQKGGGHWFGDPAGKQTTQAENTSVIDKLGKAGIYVTTNDKARSHDERQTRTKAMLRNCEVNLEWCAALDESMRNYRRPARREGVTYQKKALHNRYSHVATALEYLAVNLDVLRNLRSKPDTLPRHKAAWEAA